MTAGGRPPDAAWTRLCDEVPGRPRVVCFHAAGGSAQSFLPWRGAFEGRYGLVAAELPGRGRRYGEPYAVSVAAVAADLAAGLDRFGAGPWIFVGHSLGALIAYEAAAALRDRGAPAPLGLIVVARRAPQARAQGDGLPDGSLPAVRAYLKGLGGTPDAILADDAYMRMVSDTLQADFDLLRGYVHRPRPPLETPVHAIGALEDDAVGFEPMLGWRLLGAPGGTLTMIEGGHFSAMRDPSAVVRRIDRIRLDRPPADSEEQRLPRCA